jgi:hypothetical protein
MEPYASLFPHAKLVLRATDAVAQRVLLLPTGTAVGFDEVQMIGRILRLAVGSAGDVAHALQSRERADGPASDRTNDIRRVA